MTTFDFSDVLKLVADLGEAEAKVIPFARKSVEVTARNVKKDWQALAKAQNVDGTLRAYPRSIDYDMQLNTNGMIGADIGPNLGRSQGSFGFVEDANGGVTSAPRHDDRKAAKKNEADFMKGLLLAGEDALR